MPKEKQTKNKTLVLFDSHAIIHRAYHALPDFASSKGEPTGALYGLSSMLIKIIGDLKPDYMAACYDLPQKTFRHEAYDDYKAGRAKTDDALVSQLKSSRRIFEAFNIPMYDHPGFEADDMLGTIVEQVKKDKDLSVIIASGDMDTLQLIDGERVRVYTLKKGINDTILYDEKAVMERFNFAPVLLTDYKGLRGDPSDNIIGIAGIGEKTATTLITTFGTIEEMYKTLKKDKGAFEKAKITPRIIGLLEEGEEEALFSKTLATIRRDAPITFSLPENVWQESVDKSKVENIFREFEFKSMMSRFSALLSSDKNQPTEEIPVSKKEESLLPEDFKKTQIALWLLSSDLTNPTEEDMLDYTKTNNPKLAMEKILADVKKNNLEFVLSILELPLIPILEKMKERGILINKDHFKKLSESCHKILSGLEQKIWKEAGREFNINSPKQLGEILFDELKLSVKGLKKSSKGTRSTQVSELEKMRDLHPIIELVMEYREVQKLLSTYIDVLPSLVAQDGRIHADFIQTGTTTGRFSSANPNLQNIPAKSEFASEIRKGFISAPEHTFISADYSQIELRVLAVISNDEYLKNVFAEGRDAHTAVASRVFNVSPDEVTPEMRRRAKVINFGILYGMGINALRQNLGTDKKDAESFYQSYFSEFPSIAGYLESVKSFARTHGYTETIFGRRRYFPAIKSSLPFLRASAERMAVNAPIQGTQSDIIKRAIIVIDEKLKKEGLSDNVHLLLQVHDELIYEVKDSVKSEACKIIKETMESPFKEPESLKITIPLIVSLAEGKTWGEMRKMK